MIYFQNKYINFLCAPLLFSFISLFFLAACDQFSNLEKESPLLEKEGKRVVQTDWIEENKIKEKSLFSNTSDSSTKKNSFEKREVEATSLYTVQVGAFSIKSNAHTFIDLLVSEGRQAYVLKNPKALNQTLLSVAFGKFKTKSEAIEEAEKFTSDKKMEAVVLLNFAIQKIIRPISTSINNKVPSSISNKTKKLRKKTGRYTFQVGGLFTKKNAHLLLKRLQKLGYIPFVKKQHNEELNETWYNVQIGFFNSSETALIAAEDFAAIVKIPARVIL